jgi:hypothetical protein
MAKWVASISMFLQKNRVLKRLLFLDFPFNTKVTPKIRIHLSFSESDLKEYYMKNNSINIRFTSLTIAAV